MALTSPSRHSSRRDFLTLSAALQPPLWSARSCRPRPLLRLRPNRRRSTLPSPDSAIGIELYAVRGELTKDLAATLRRVAKSVTSRGVLFAVSRLELSLCERRAHAHRRSRIEVLFDAQRRERTDRCRVEAKAIELNQILGSRYIIAASPPRGIPVKTAGTNCRTITAATEALKSHGLSAGFHNHASEWKPVAEGGPRAMAFLRPTRRENSCSNSTSAPRWKRMPIRSAGSKESRRIQSDPSQGLDSREKEEEKAYRVLFGEGVTPWKE